MEEGLRKTSRIGSREPTLDWGLGQSGENKPYTGSDFFPIVPGTIRETP